MSSRKGFQAGNTIIGEADPLMGLPILTKDEGILFIKYYSSHINLKVVKWKKFSI